MKTPALARVVSEAFGAIDALKAGEIERGDAMALSSHLGRVTTAVATDVKARLAAPRIAAYEAKLVDGDSHAAIERSKT